MDNNKYGYHLPDDTFHLSVEGKKAIFQLHSEGLSPNRIHIKTAIPLRIIHRLLWWRMKKQYRPATKWWQEKYEKEL